MVIPTSIRDALGLRPGDAVSRRLDGRGVVIEPVADLLAPRGAFAGSGLLADLERERVAERERDRDARR